MDAKRVLDKIKSPKSNKRNKRCLKKKTLRFKKNYSDNEDNRKFHREIRTITLRTETMEIEAMDFQMKRKNKKLQDKNLR